MCDDCPDDFTRQAEEAYAMTQYFAAQQRRELERRARENQPFAADLAVRRFRRGRGVDDSGDAVDGGDEKPLSAP